MMSSLGVHDIGGLEEEFGPVDTREYGFQLWEMKVMNVMLMFMLTQCIQVHATLILLTQQGLMSTDELRRAMECLPGHKTMSYYHRWSAGMITVSLERGTITQEELNTELGTVEESVTEPRSVILL